MCHVISKKKHVIEGLFDLELLIVCHHSAAFFKYKCFGHGDVVILICQVILQNHVT